MVSWDAKRWVQGLLYDGDPRVRAMLPSTWYGWATRAIRPM